MAVNDIGPAYVEIDYVGPNGFHTMSRPTLAWTGTPFASGGTFGTHDAGSISDSTMINAFINLMLPLLDTDQEVTQSRIYTKSSPTSTPVLVKVSNYTGLVGDTTAIGWEQAVQRTYTFYTEGAGIAKIVLLDVPGDNSFAPRYTLPALTPDLALAEEFMDESNGWVGRDGERPAAFNKLTITLNEKLRRNQRLS